MPATPGTVYSSRLSLNATFVQGTLEDNDALQLVTEIDSPLY